MIKKYEHNDLKNLKRKIDQRIDYLERIEILDSMTDIYENRDSKNILTDLLNKNNHNDTENENIELFKNIKNKLQCLEKFEKLQSEYTSSPNYLDTLREIKKNVREILDINYGRSIDDFYISVCNRIEKIENNDTYTARKHYYIKYMHKLYKKYSNSDIIENVFVNYEELIDHLKKLQPFDNEKIQGSGKSEKRISLHKVEIIKNGNIIKMCDSDVILYKYINN